MANNDLEKYAKALDTYVLVFNLNGIGFAETLIAQ